MIEVLIRNLLDKEYYAAHFGRKPDFFFVVFTMLSFSIYSLPVVDYWMCG